MRNIGAQLALAFVLSLTLYPQDAQAEPCFASDADDFYDKDGLANGVITVTAASESSVPAATTPYDCTALDFSIGSGGRLTLETDPGTGAIAALQASDVTIAAGGVIDSDLQGCTGVGGGFGPDEFNACIGGGPGAGGNGNDFGGAGGGGHGGAGERGGVGAGGVTHDSATLPSRLGSSGGATGGTGGGPGGTGGGVVSITATSLTHDGLISANAGDGGGGGGRVAGGGAGGSVIISVGTLAGVTGTFETRGGAGIQGSFAPGGGAGGGGGGRISVLFDASTFTFDAADFDVSGGPGGTAGDPGTVYVRDRTLSSVRIFHGFTFADSVHTESSWIADDGADNQYCDRLITPAATPGITAENVVLGGTIDCSEEIASFTVTQTGPAGALVLPLGSAISANGALTLDATTALEMGGGVAFANTRRATDLVLGIPAGNDQIWSDVSVDGAAEGRIVIDSAIALSLLTGTTVAGNPDWPALTSLTIDATSSIDADAKGCLSIDSAGRAPDDANVCASQNSGAGGNGNDFGGGGGGGHGGNGASGGVGSGGVTYDSATLPARFGASGGATGGTGGGLGGAGGGLIEITTAALVHEGVVTADGVEGGGDGGRVTGGGAGGSITISAGTIGGTTGTFQARGGNGIQGTLSELQGGGGGGGGRVAVLFDTSTFVFDANDFDVSAGTGGAGSNKGTVYVRDRTTSTVRIFHGFTFADIDHEEATWNADPSATNQYCDRTLSSDATPSISAGAITLGGAIDCTPQITSFDVTQNGLAGGLTIPDGAALSVNGALMLDAGNSLAIGTGATIATSLAGADLVVELPDGNDQTWRGVTFEGAPEGRLFMDAAIALSLLEGTAVRANPAWPALTALSIDATSSINATAKGCQPRGGGAGPTCANACEEGESGFGGNGNDFGGGGGGGHGGVGGNGGVGAGGAVYDLEIDPRLFGASGGSTGGTGGGPGGTGGGVIEISVDGTFANDGAIAADGGNGAGSGGRVSGAGAAGAINISAGTYTCTTGGSFSAAGGDGQPADASIGGGGGGGGRIIVDAGADTCATAPLSALDPAAVALGGTGGSGAEDGGAGTVRFGDTRACADPQPFRAAASRSRDNTVSASDALFVLQTAVGSRCCSLCVCDVNDSQDITATDALLVLKRAVGQSIDLLCPPCA